VSGVSDERALERQRLGQRTDRPPTDQDAQQSGEEQTHGGRESHCL